MLRHITLLLLTIVIATMAVLFAGCGGNDAPTGQVFMAIVPRYGGVVADHAYGEHWSGPAGKYSLGLESGVGSPVAMRYDPADRYAFTVEEVTSFGDAYPDSFIRTVSPDSAELYDLSPAGSYRVVAYELGEFDATPVAECQIRTSSAQ